MMELRLPTVAVLTVAFALAVSMLCVVSADEPERRGIPSRPYTQDMKDWTAILGSPGSYQQQGGITETQLAYVGFASGLWEPAEVAALRDTITTGLGVTVNLSVAGLEYEGVGINDLVLEDLKWIIEEEERVLNQPFPFSVVQVLDTVANDESCGWFSVSLFSEDTAIIMLRCFYTFIIAHEVAHSWFSGGDVHERIADQVALQVLRGDEPTFGRGEGVFGQLREHYGDAEFNHRIMGLTSRSANMADVRTAFGDDGAATKIINASEAH